MDTLLHLFSWPNDPSLLLTGTYDLWLVALSLAIATFASTMGLNASYQARNMQTPHLRRVTLLTGSLSLGCGVWAMHFIGMLSFRLCTHVSYNASLTTASMLPSIGASWVALHLLAQERITTRQLLMSGLLMGAGIGAMHYSGMAAMNMSAALRYDLPTFLLSIVVAVGLAVLSLWVRFRLSRQFGGSHNLWQNAAAGLVMGLAISGMHYTGMAAARFVGVAEGRSGLSINDPVPLALSITLVTVVATVLVAAAGGLAQYRQLVEQLQYKERKLRAVSNTAPDGIIVMDEQGLIREVNDGATRIYGWQPHELVGHSITRIMVEPYRTQATEDIHAYLGTIDQVLGVEFQNFGLRRNGSQVPIRLIMGKTQVDHRPLYVAYVTDISERVRMESALRASESQFRTLIANIPGIAYRCKLEKGWPMVFTSDAVERVTGFPAGDFMGQMPSLRFSDLLPREDALEVARVVEAAVQDGLPFVLEFRLRHRDGSQRWMWGNGSVVRDEDGEVKWIDGVMLDITERRQMEEELRRAKERAEAAATARSTFLANMSHEIRTPMNAIIGFTEVVLGSPLEDNQRKHLDTVRRSARSLLHLLNDILDSSKLERGALELEQIDFSVRDLVSQLCSELSIQATRKGLVLRQEVDPQMEPYLRGDPHRLRQILVNLVGNAIKFTEVGQVSIVVTREREFVHFQVRDTGIGIAADRLESIFDPFTQADASMSRRFGGTGLGTTISKQLVELMHGKIWVNSIVGMGSTFHVRIPMATGRAELALTQAPVADMPTLAPLRMLAVDDVPQNIELLTVMLTRLGHQVVSAADGAEALQRFREQDFDVILMDVQMPVMDGLEASRAIRIIEGDVQRRRTPIIALSASVLPEDRQAALDAGMDGFSVKPVELAKLLSEVSRVTHGVPAASVPAAPIPTAAEGTLLPLEPQLVDQARALTRWGQLDTYRRVLMRFVAEYDIWQQDPRWAQAPAHPESVAAEAHRIKGVAGNLGLSLLSNTSEQTEHAARHGSHSDMQQAWEAMRQALAATVDNLRVLDGLHAAPATDRKAEVTETDLEALRHDISLLVSALKRGEHLESRMQRFIKQAQPVVGDDILRNVQSALDDFDFDEAAKVLERIGVHLDRPEEQRAAL